MHSASGCLDLAGKIGKTKRYKSIQFQFSTESFKFEFVMSEYVL